MPVAHGQQSTTPRPASIHILDDDPLFHIFHLYRQFLLGEYDDGAAILMMDLFHSSVLARMQVVPSRNPSPFVGKPSY